MIKNASAEKPNPVPESGRHFQNQSAAEKEDVMFPDYSIYPPRDDIYNKGKKVDLNPEDLSKTKESPEKPGTTNEPGIGELVLGGDLDVPGAELDDRQESVGSEDEENNYYSLGGDGHCDLDEDTVGS